MSSRPTNGRFSVTGLDHERNDPNPILDEGIPTSTGSMTAAFKLCQKLGTRLKVEAAKRTYERGWGSGCHEAKQVVATWTL